MPYATESCPVCGGQGACAYDAEGRALIHTDNEAIGNDWLGDYPVGDPDEAGLGRRVEDIDMGRPL